MEYWFPCPDPDDKQGWKQWTKCHTYGAAVVVVIALVFLALCGK